MMPHHNRRSKSQRGKSHHERAAACLEHPSPFDKPSGISTAQRATQFFEP